MKQLWVPETLSAYTILMLVVLAGCSTDMVNKTSELSDGSQILTFRCSTNWSNCHVSANKACGTRGYTEIDRAASGSITNSGRMHDRENTTSQGTGIYKEDVRQDDYYRVLTIRCD